jgi:hypothetical protein
VIRFTGLTGQGRGRFYGGIIYSFFRDTGIWDRVFMYQFFMHRIRIWNGEFFDFRVFQCFMIWFICIESFGYRVDYHTPLLHTTPNDDDVDDDDVYLNKLLLRLRYQILVI